MKDFKPEEPEIIKSKVSFSDPVTIEIPKINVNSKVQKVALTETGDIGTPSGTTKYKDVGWYTGSSIPGEKGKSIIVGHFNGRGALPAVFFDLGKLEVGDEIFVNHINGEKSRFVVFTKESVSYDNPPLEKIFAPTDEKIMILFTCEGIWIPDKKTYDARLLVYTRLDESY